MYLENPKTKGSGIVTCIPQTGRCPNNCADCFFQSGRSYLEPLAEHLPNMPSAQEAEGRLVRVNDGNDSNVDRETVILETARYFPMRFFNTAIARDLFAFPGPVVLTVNPGPHTDEGAILLPDIPPNLMFVRVRANAWNLGVVDKAVAHYTSREVPAVLTFMAYFTQIVPDEYAALYVYRQRTLNSYWAITTDAWRSIMARYEDSVWVHSCGKIEGEHGSTKCRHCGNCIREYFATMERLRPATEEIWSDDVNP